MPMRRSSAGTWTAPPPTTSPEIRMSPAVARSRPATARSSVVLPQPDGPIRTPMSPARRPNDTPSTARCARPGYWTDSCESSTNMSSIVDAYNSHLHQEGFEASAMRAPRLQDLVLLLFATLLVLPVLAVLASWLQWDRQSAQVLGEMA